MSVGLFCKFDGGAIVLSDGFEYNPATWEKRTDSVKFAIFQKPFGHGVIVCTGNPELSKKVLAQAPLIDELTLQEFAKATADFLRKEAGRISGYPREADKFLEQTPVLIFGYDKVSEKFQAFQITRGFQTVLEGTDFFAIGIGAQFAFNGRIRQKLKTMEEALESALLGYANSLKIRGVEGYPRVQVVGSNDVSTLDAPTCTFLGNLAALDLLSGTKLLKEEVSIMPATEKQVSPAVIEKLKEIHLGPQVLFRTQFGASNWQEILMTEGKGKKEQ